VHTGQRRQNPCDCCRPLIDEGYHVTAQLNHTIVYSADRAKSARFLAEILGGRHQSGSALSKW
jgi:hypothetical protein